MQNGTLKIRDVKNGKEYRVAFVNAKGKSLEMVIQPADRLFDPAKVVDGDPVHFELDKAGRPVKCVVPGKEGQPAPRPARPAGSGTVPRSGTSAAHGTPAKGSASARCDAVAPYNFIPFESGAVIPAFEDEEGVWSGKIVCELMALTPLLVSGRQTKAGDNAPSECRFMRVDGHNVIPGTSIKGMLRSLLKILSFSHMRPVADKPLFWRRVDRPEYREGFPQDVVLGGYLRKEGANYALFPVQVTPKDPRDPAVTGCERVKTGGMKTKDKDSKVYYFSKPTEKRISLDRDVVNDFWEQLTPNQKSRWPREKRNELMTSFPGLPVFYRQDGNGTITDLGFCRYFRLKYAHTPYSLVYPDDRPLERDFVTRLFGAVGKKSGESFKGRVSVSPARVNGDLLDERGIRAVLGTPKPTCLPLYLEQDAATVTLMPKNALKNNLDTMRSYDHPSARLRGYKWYWHHDADKRFFPGADAATEGRANDKVASQLYPVAEGAGAKIVIHVDRLTDTELGGLLEAIDLPEGHAHKLGMGKSLGLGSVRLRIAEARVTDIRKVHGSLSGRLEGRGDELMDEETRRQLRDHFRNRVLEAVRAKHQPWKNITGYDQLPPIRALRIMMDFAHRPAPDKVRTMSLRRDRDNPLTEVNFGVNAILPGPEQVIKK